MARSATAARRYAEAAFEIAGRDGTVDAWRADLDGAADGRWPIPPSPVGSSNPAVPLEPRGSWSWPASARRSADPCSTSCGCWSGAAGFDVAARDRRRVPAARQPLARASPRPRVTSAAPLEPAEVKALIARLEQMTGGQVELDQEVDPSLLGGLVVRIGDRLIDGSVRGRLERLRNQLVSGAL